MDHELRKPGTRHEAFATRVVFFVVGLGLSAWAPLVPYAKERLAIDDASLGLILLCLGAGSIVSMPAAGPLVARYGCRAVILLASAGLAVILPVLAFGASFPLMTAAVFVFGAANGAIDVAMNVQAVIVEKASGRAMMSGFHALFSLGGITGAGGVSLLLGLGITPLAAATGVALVLAALIALSAKGLLTYGNEEGAATPFFVLPRGPVILIGALCFVCFLAEGAVLDWSALFLTFRGVDPVHGGVGYAVFALAMTFGRLTGDGLVTLLGGRKVLLYGSLCAATGFLLPVLLPLRSAALTGFVLIGLGASNIVPVLFTAVGRQTAVPSHLAVAAISTLGYTGILTGPALIGFVSEATSLPGAFAMIAAMMVLITLGSRYIPHKGQ